MGNHTGKDSHRTTGSPLDFFHTPATTPSETGIITMALSSAASSNKLQTPSPHNSTSPSNLLADWTQKLPSPSEWAVISVESITSSQTTAGDAATRCEKAAASMAPLLPSRGSLTEDSWHERDSGLGPQATEEGAGEEATLVLFSLMEHYRTSLGLTPNTDATTGAVELFRRLITQKDELVEELDTLKEMLRTERLEWHQFQCDLQVAVSVADRLRVESEQALVLLQESHRALEEQLSQALHKEQDKDRELESLRAEHRDVCRKLAELTLQQQQERAELDALRNALQVKDVADRDQQTGNQGSGEQEEMQGENETEAEITNGEMQKISKDTNEEVEIHDPLKRNGSDSTQLTGKGVAEGYLRCLAVLEKKKERQRDPRRIEMLCERSWSLSHLHLQTESCGENDTSNKTNTTLPLCKKEEPLKQRRMGCILQQQDTGFCTGKQDEDQSSNSTKPQDGFSALLKRYGGSRRNSLLRWCQSRMRGYKNIDITNFSSSWEDGLAFSALYHTYLPGLIAYDTLNPADKKENLNLAFKTGENVGIAASLTVEEMLNADGPDWQKVLAYVESVFRHFEM